MKVRVESATLMTAKDAPEAMEFMDYIKSFIKGQSEYYKLKEEGKDEEALIFYDEIQEKNKNIADHLRLILEIDNLMCYFLDEESDGIVIHIFEKNESLEVGKTYPYGQDEEGLYIEV